MEEEVHLLINILILDLQRVRYNTIEICKVTHADPRCVASCVAVTSAVSLMLQGKYPSGGFMNIQ
jgi:ADP-ribosylglycohydrolase